MNLEERLEYLDANSNDPAIWAEWEGWVFAKLREAVGLAKLEELDNGYLRCRFCQATKFKGGTQIHKPDCRAQKFLEG